jgi:hypothetical protein
MCIHLMLNYTNFALGFVSETVVAGIPNLMRILYNIFSLQLCKQVMCRPIVLTFSSYFLVDAEYLASNWSIMPNINPINTAQP